MYYRLHIAYDGTQYHGWQHQGTVPTIAGELSRAFTRTFQLPLVLVGASRTDIGVHAYGQVARCNTEFVMPAERLCAVWNRALPYDIQIKGMSVVDRRFHPQAHVLMKTYWYHIFVKRPLPFYAPYGWHIITPIDLEKLMACLSYAIGEHDFRSFCTGSDLTDTVRTIHHIEIVPLKRFGAFRIIVQGPRFLYRMIRRLIGAAVYVATHADIPVETYRDVFSARNSCHALTTAPAHGLMLRKIIYQE